MEAEVLYKFLKVNLKAAAEFRFEFVFRAFIELLNNFILYASILYLAYSNNGISVFSFDEMIMAITIFQFAFIFGLNFFGGFTHRIQMLIITGDFDKLLVRPIHPYWHMLVYKMNMSAAGEIITGILMLFLNKVENIPFILLFSLLSGVIIHFIAFIYSIIPFFLEQNIENHFIDILFNISWYPPTIYNKFMQFVVFFIFPGAMISFGPILILKNPSFFYVYMSFLILVMVSFFVLLDFGLKRYKSAGY